jgi:hypothetical protein
MIRKIRRNSNNKGQQQTKLRGGCGCASNWLSNVGTSVGLSTPKTSHKSSKKSRKSKRKTAKKSSSQRKRSHSHRQRKRSHSHRTISRNQRGGFAGCQLATVMEPGFKISGNTAMGINGLDIPEAKTYIYRGNCGSGGCGTDHAGF